MALHCDLIGMFKAWLCAKSGHVWKGKEFIYCEHCNIVKGV